MDLVIDANILFAALIKDNVTRILLFDDGISLYAPEFLFEEIGKYSSEICRKSGRSEKEFSGVLSVLASRINIVKWDRLRPHLMYAAKISPDPKDVPYIAACLALDCALWTNDKELKGIGIKTYSTGDLVSS